MHRCSLCLVLVSALLVIALPAHAYLDPASGSMILQLILGGLAGIALAAKLYWRKLLNIFGRKKRENDNGAA